MREPYAPTPEFGLWWSADDNAVTLRWYLAWGDHRIARVICNRDGDGAGSKFQACFFADEIRDATFRALSEAQAWCEEVSKAWTARKMLGG